MTCTVQQNVDGGPRDKRRAENSCNSSRVVEQELPVASLNARQLPGLVRVSCLTVGTCAQTCAWATATAPLTPRRSILWAVVIR